MSSTRRATASRAAPRFRIGIDVGGTFTDLFLLDQESGRVVRHKLPSTPAEPHRAPLAGLKQILEMARGAGGEAAFVGLGTTVATNALLERKGAATGLVTTAGFRDLLEIARQKRPHTFDLYVSKPEPLVPRRLRREVAERVAADGSVLEPLDRAQLSAAIDELRAAGVDSIAICFLNSYANPRHEETAAVLARERWPDGHVSVSCEVLPEFREYERLSSTVVNAYLMPMTREYFNRFEADVAGLGIGARPLVMNSGGGVITPAAAVERPIDTLFSGPSGGVSGAVYVATRSGHPDIITFDMGGTSTDVCVVQDGKPQVSYSRVINGFPLKAAALDVHTVGAGGSSIAAVDAGGLLQVGPASAGARPGPACYGLGGEDPTVTDANVVLGRLNPQHLLGGALKIDASRSAAAIEKKINKFKKMRTTEAAASIIAIADTNMAQAVRFVSIERGLDPKDFVLVAFGGAGPLHAAAVARQLGVAGVLIPYSPGVLCAMGVLAKDVQMDFSRTRVVAEGAPGCGAAVNEVFQELEGRARSAGKRQGWTARELALERSADVRYVGQNHELSVAAPAGEFGDKALRTVKENFHRAHERFYGYRSPDKRLELVTCRVKAVLPIDKHDLAQAPPVKRNGALRPVARRRVFFDEGAGFLDCPIYDRGALQAGDRLAGPAIIEQMDTTTLVPPRFVARVDRALNLYLSAGRTTSSHRRGRGGR